MAFFCYFLLFKSQDKVGNMDVKGAGKLGIHCGE